MELEPFGLLSLWLNYYATDCQLFCNTQWYDLVCFITRSIPETVYFFSVCKNKERCANHSLLGSPNDETRPIGCDLQRVKIYIRTTRTNKNSLFSLLSLECYRHYLSTLIHRDSFSLQKLLLRKEAASQLLLAYNIMWCKHFYSGYFDSPYLFPFHSCQGWTSFWFAIGVKGGERADRVKVRPVRGSGSCLWSMKLQTIWSWFFSQKIFQLHTFNVWNIMHKRRRVFDHQKLRSLSVNLLLLPKHSCKYFWIAMYVWEAGYY